MFVDSLLYSVIVPVLPVYADQLDASTTAIGALYAMYAIGLVVAAPVLGRWSDRVGRRKAVLLGSAGIVVTTALYAVAGTFPLLVAARVLQGVAAAAVWTAGIALVAETVPEHRVGRAMGTVMAAMSAGLILGPPVGGALEQAGGHRLLFGVLVGVCTVAGLTQAALIRDATGAGQARDPVGGLLRDPRLRGTVVAVFLVASALSMLEPIMPLELADRFNAGPLLIGLIFGAATLANGAASPLTGAIADRVDRGRLMALGLVGAGVLMGALAVPAPDILVVAAVLVGFAVAYGFVIVPALSELAAVARTHGNTGYATVYAAFNISYSLGMLLGPLAGGAGADIAIGPTLLVAAIILAAAGTFAYLAPRARATRPRHVHHGPQEA
jgi:multidrug resistance protein